MSKTRAEIQRAYRERNKQKEGSQYLQKERERVKKYYITSSELSRSDRKKTHVIKLISNRQMRERPETYSCTFSCVCGFYCI